MATKITQKETKKPILRVHILKQENYNESLTYLLNERLTSNTYLIYVSLNKPCSTIKNMLETSNISKERIYVINLVSPSSTCKELNCVHLSAETNLTELSFAISQAIYDLAGKNILFVFDSVSTLLIYNEQNLSLRFLHFISSKLRENNIDASFLSLNSKEDITFAQKMAAFIDEIKKA